MEDSRMICEYWSRLWNLLRWGKQGGVGLEEGTDLEKKLEFLSALLGCLWGTQMEIVSGQLAMSVWRSVKKRSHRHWKRTYTHEVISAECRYTMKECLVRSHRITPCPWGVSGASLVDVPGVHCLGKGLGTTITFLRRLESVGQPADARRGMLLPSCQAGFAFQELEMILLEL